MHSRYRYRPGTPNGFAPAATRRIATEDSVRGESFFMPGYGSGGFDHDPGRGVAAKGGQAIFLERKEDLFMEAGRLAAEYMVAHGFLPAGALYPESRHSPPRHLRQQRTRGRVSALARLGSVVPDYTTAKRRYANAAADHGVSPNGARASSSKGRKRSRSSRRSNGNRPAGNAWCVDRNPRLQPGKEHDDKEEDTDTVKDFSDCAAGQNPSQTEKERGDEDEAKKADRQAAAAGGSESPSTAAEPVEAMNLPATLTNQEEYKKEDGREGTKPGRGEEEEDDGIPERPQSEFAGSSSPLPSSDADLLQGIPEGPNFGTLSFEAFLKIIGE